MKNKIFLILIYCLSYKFASARTETQMRVCEPIKIQMCSRMGYNLTSLPNLIGHDYQTDVDLTLQTFSPLISYGCSAQLSFFLCATYLPMCSEKIGGVIGPCRSLCEAVRARCHPVLTSFGFQWPNSLNCSRFPKDNNHENMCMEGPGEPTLDLPPTNIKPSQSSCKYLFKSHLYVRLSRNNKCTPLCEADILFESNEKQIAWLFIGSWSFAALLISSIALLCLILSDVSWDRSLLPLVCVHCLSSLSWGIRILAGRNNTSCGYDNQFPGISLLLNDGHIATSPCSSTFLLRYYFGMCAASWVAIFCYRWNFLIKQHMAEVLNGQPSGIIKGFRNGRFLQFCAFGLPLIQTVFVLWMKLVDADELLGTCYVGNQSDKALLSLVAIPILIYWTIGTGYLLTGYLTKKSLPNFHLTAYLNSLGSFLLIYNILTVFILLSLFFIFGNRESWLMINLDGLQQQQPTAPLWLYMLHPFLELLLAVLTAAWAIGPRLRAGFCRTEVKQPSYKQPPTVSSYQQNASYQSICVPPNSMISLTTPAKIYKYPNPHYSSSSSRACRSSFRRETIL
ncbi:hypothetical protein PVAND_005561 [Polypedilum vanderplanki]|uniref:Frizzled-4 n=1 Tax=Polypedilum vanderplanki TaxID=319348 RepID=A0A9J6C1I8_POLVA|nr:hypothetical protein PVAND_005561 [Polypedilum vanderplanki]